MTSPATVRELLYPADIPATPPTHLQIVRACKQCTPRMALKVFMSPEVWEVVGPRWAAIESAKTRSEKRSAWRLWSKTLDRLERKYEAEERAAQSIN